MRLGATDSDAYLEGWRQSEWEARDGSPEEVVEAVAQELDAEYDRDPRAGIARLVRHLTRRYDPGSLSPSQGGSVGDRCQEALHPRRRPRQGHGLGPLHGRPHPHGHARTRSSSSPACPTAASRGSTRPRREALPGVFAVVTARATCPTCCYGDFVQDRTCSHGRRALRGRRRRRRRSDHAGDRPAGRRRDRRRLRAAAGRQRPRGSARRRRASSCTPTGPRTATPTAWCATATTPRSRRSSRATSSRAWRDADIVVTSRYVADGSHAAPIEPRAVVAQWEGDKVTIWTSTQVPFDARSGVVRDAASCRPTGCASSCRTSAAASAASAASTTRRTSPRSRARPSDRCAWCSRAARSSSRPTAAARAWSSTSRAA